MATKTVSYVPHPGKDYSIGGKFGRWTVLSFSHTVRHICPTGATETAYVKCRCGCDAKTERAVSLPRLRRGGSVSCGCYLKAWTSQNMRTHGWSQHPAYNTWKNMIDRCTNRDSPSYKDYMGRGIRVCDRWMNVDAFMADMLPAWKPGLSLERANNSGNYEPQNCIWATRGVQMNNKRDNVRLTYGGETLTAAQWGRRLGIHGRTIRARLKYGWSVEEAVTTPIGYPR